MLKDIYKDISAFHPGYYVQEIIEDMGITQSEFAKRLNTTSKTLSKLLNGEIPLSNDLAENLSLMLGTSINVWINLQKKYEEKCSEIDKKRKIDVINSRDKDDAVVILKKFKNVKTVTRDFSQTYKNAINEALPKAKQIVDRFHIFKNLTDDLNSYMKRTIADTIKMIDNKDIEKSEEEIILNRRQKNKKESAERKWNVIQEVQKLYQDGYNKSQISRKMNITRATVNTYLLQKQPLERSTNSILDKYVPMIKELIIQGKK